MPFKARPEIRVEVGWAYEWAEKECHPSRENSMKTEECHEDQLNPSAESREEVTGDQAGGRIRALAKLRELEFVTQAWGAFGGCIGKYSNRDPNTVTRIRKHLFSPSHDRLAGRPCCQGHSEPEVLYAFFLDLEHRSQVQVWAELLA